MSARGDRSPSSYVVPAECPTAWLPGGVSNESMPNRFGVARQGLWPTAGITLVKSNLAGNKAEHRSVLTYRNARSMANVTTACAIMITPPPSPTPLLCCFILCSVPFWLLPFSVWCIFAFHYLFIFFSLRQSVFYGCRLDVSLIAMGSCILCVCVFFGFSYYL